MVNALRILYPPSTNRLWRSVRGRNIASQEYRDWKRGAGNHLLAQRVHKTHGSVTVHLVVTPPDKRLRDLDNTIKPCLDLLASLGIIEGDNMRVIRRLVVVAGEPDKAAPGVMAYIEPWEETA